LTFLVADSGVGASTHETVGAVRQLFEKDPETTQKHFERIGEIVREARTFLSQGDSSGLGELMDSDQSVLKALTVSSPRLDTLTQTARDMGALGAKLSGSGRRGNIIVLVSAQDAGRISAALSDAGAKQVWTMTLGSDPS